VSCNIFYSIIYLRNLLECSALVALTGKTEVILGIPWLQAHNPEINWKTGEVKMTRCLPLCGRKSKRKERVRMTAIEEEEKIVH